MTELVAGNRLDLLVSGAQYFPALEAALDQAQHETYLECYIFEDDQAGRWIAEALKRTAKRGVRVHLMIDGFGSRTLSGGFIQDLMQAGVMVLVYRPEAKRLALHRHRLLRMHRKLAAIDSKIGFVGGINIIDDMHTPNHTPPRYDYGVRVQGPLAEYIHRAAERLWKLITWTQFKQEWRRELRIRPAPTVSGGQIAALVVRDNFRHRRDIEDAYLDAIAKARTEILIANAYFLPGINFRHALTQAKARGVRVILLLQGRVEYVLLHYASRALYGSLLDAGIEIFEYRKSFMHAKVAVIDRRWATVGSSNIDPFSLLLAREANLVIEDRRFADALRRDLQRAIDSGAAPVLRESWSQQPLASRMICWGSYGLGRVLTGVFGYGAGHELL
jgi:cardiolipin synthase